MTDPTSPIDSLGELMRAAQQGDGASYVELLRTITPRIRQIIMRQRGFVGIAEVEDLVQDVLLSVHAVRPPTIRLGRSYPGCSLSCAIGSSTARGAMRESRGARFTWMRTT